MRKVITSILKVFLINSALLKNKIFIVIKLLYDYKNRMLKCSRCVQSEKSFGLEKRYMDN